MDKNNFFSQYAISYTPFELPDGQSVDICPLSVGQRAVLNTFTKTDPALVPAKVVCMGCQIFDDEDMDAIKSMPGDLIQGIADAILNLSGLGDKDQKKD